MIEKITEEEIRSLGVSSLPRSPSAPSLYGGRSMDSVALRAAFDRLPVCIARKVNAIIDGLGLAGEEGERVAALLATGLFEGHSLEDLFGDIRSGRLAAYLTFEDGETLADKAVRWEALHGEAVKRLTRGSLLYATDEGGATVGLAYGEETLPHTVPLRGKDGALLDVALHDASGDAHADLRERLTEVEREVTLRARARVFDTWEDALVFCTVFDREAAQATLSVGDRILIRDGSVPDGWVSGFAEVAVPYPGGLGILDPFGDSVAITVGFMILSPLEGPKVDLSGLTTKEETERALAELQSSVISERAEAGEVSRLKAEVSNLRAALAPEYFEADNSAAYVKLVPPFALPFAEVQEVGGMTHAVDGVLKNAAVTAIESVGKNLQQPFDSPSFVYAGITFTTNADGTVSAKGTATGEIYRFMPPFKAKPSTPYTFGGSPSGGSNNTYYVAFRQLDESGARIEDFGEYGEGGTYNVSVNVATAQLGLCIRKGQTVNFVFSPYAYEGQVEKVFIPYAKRTYPIPDEVQALEGWGLGVDETYHNRIDWEKKQYRQEVAKIRLPSDYAAGGINEEYNWYYFSLSKIGIAGNSNFLCEGLPIAQVQADPNAKGVIMNSGKTALLVRIEGLTTRQEYRDYFVENEVYVVAQLAEPIVTDLSAILPDDNFIEVEGGGIVTAVNEDKLAAPTKIEYQLKEVTA